MLITRLEPFEPSLVEYLRLHYVDRVILSPRAYIPVQNVYLYNATGALSRISAIFGFTPEESKVLKLQEVMSSSIVPWFEYEYSYACYNHRRFSKRFIR